MPRREDVVFLVKDADGGVHDGLEVEEEPRLDGAGEEARQVGVGLRVQHPDFAVGRGQD